MNQPLNIAKPVNSDDAPSVEMARTKLQQQDLAGTESICRTLIRDNPKHAEAILMLAQVARLSGHTEQALRLFKKSVKLAPDRAEGHFHLANCHYDLGELDQAISAYRRALEINPALHAAEINLANTLLATNMEEEAVELSEATLQVYPNSVQALSNLAQANMRLGDLWEARQNLTDALGLAPGHPEILNNLGVACQLQGDVDSAIDHFRAGLAADPHNDLSRRNIQVAVLNQPDVSPVDLFSLHRSLNAGLAGRRQVRDNFNHLDRSTDRKLRVGILSSDFCDHPVGRNVIPLIENLDSNAVEIWLYSANETEDSLTGEFQSLADNWADVGGYSDEAIAEYIAADHVDIMIYLAGRFNRNRSEVAAYRPAPVQISFHDCATTAVPEMDYWLTDEYFHPEDTRELFTETLYRLPAFYQFRPPEYAPHPAKPPMSSADHVTFGSFSKPEKINNQVLDVWCDILTALPKSELILKYRNFFSDNRLKKVWLAKFTGRGIDSDRVHLMAQDDFYSDHLALYSQVDITLDPFPFNGATTTFESLYMGVPVVALEGEHFVDRVAGNFMTHCGEADLVAANRQAYLQTAVNLANSSEKLSALRLTLRQQLLQSTLCDAKKYARNMEFALQDMWRTWCNSQIH